MIAVANQKGGVGKTTTVLHLGVALHGFGYRSLLVDLDPQACLTFCCGLDPENLGPSVYEALVDGMPAGEVLCPTRLGPDLLPATVDLSLAEVELVNQVARERRLGGVLAGLRDTYDFVFVDCQPSLGLLTVNALAAADELIIPVSCEYLAIRGIRALLKLVGRVRLQLNSRLAIDGILPTLYDTRTRHARDVLQELAHTFEPRVPLFPVVVDRSVRFAEAARARETVFSYARHVPGAEGYREAARWLLASVRRQQAVPAP